MPKYPDQIAMALKLPMSSVRVHYDVDVGGSYGVKRGIKHTVLVGYLSQRLGVPVRLIEDRLENMRGGDMHGPERIFDVEVAFDDARHHPLDEDARARQRRRLCRAARRSSSASRSAPSSGRTRSRACSTRPIAVVTNKTRAGGGARASASRRPTTRIERTIDEVANRLGLDRLEVRRRNLIRHDEFPYLIPSGSTYD